MTNLSTSQSAKPAVTMFHNPHCSTSRQVLGLIRERGIEPTVIEYLKNPPSRAALAELIAALGIPVRELLRSKEVRYAELQLDVASDDELISAIAANPILMNRPVVASALGARLCRPAERVLELLPPT